MSFPLTPSKRPYPAEQNGKGKWKKQAGSYSHLQPLKILPGVTCFRLLCPLSKSGSVIGKGGAIISKIRQETGAKVRVEEPIPGDDERLILIVGPDTEKPGDANDEKKEQGKDNNVIDDTNGVKENQDKISSPTQDPQSEKATSSVQKALMLVFERMVVGEQEKNEGDEETNEPSSFYVRLLVFKNQVGCILGKSGSMIKQMAAESNAQIRILSKEKLLPQCVSGSDELIQLTGGVEAVRKALQLVSQQLLENPPRDIFPTGKPMALSSHPPATFPKPQVFPQSNHQFLSQGGHTAGPHVRFDNVPHANPKYRESLPPSHAGPFDMTFRLLCHNEQVGGIIGKGGSIVKTIHHETGCAIRILEGVYDIADRIVTITGSAAVQHPNDPLSPVQDAVLRVQERIISGARDIIDKPIVAKIVVSTSQIGCLLGMGGTIVQEMQKSSGAFIRAVIARNEIPKCVSENEQVVQISGEFKSVQDALLQITTRLRHNQFGDTFPSVNHPTRPTFPDQPPSFPFLGRREHSPPGMYSNLRPSFNKFEAVGGLPPHGRIHPMDDRPGFMQSVHRPGIAHGPGRIPSSAPWEPQGLPDGGGPMSISEYGGVPPGRPGGFGGGSQAPIITNTTVEVVVPRAIVPSIYGEDGGSLNQIQQISGTKITITEPKPGATETAVIISGTPEQTHAAQSLLQAFVLSGTDSP